MARTLTHNVLYGHQMLVVTLLPVAPLLLTMISPEELLWPVSKSPILNAADSAVAKITPARL
jgi:hypothetical protein